MAEVRKAVSVILKIIFTIIVAIVMILWIASAAMSFKEINNEDANQRRQNQQNRNIYYNSKVYDRMKGMTVFNTVLQEVIALIAIIGAIVESRYIFQTSALLLSIIWFVAHYRINDVLWEGSGVMIAAHILLFIVCVLGLVFCNFFSDKKADKDKSSKVNGSPA